MLDCREKGPLGNIRRRLRENDPFHVPLSLLNIPLLSMFCCRLVSFRLHSSLYSYE